MRLPLLTLLALAAPFFVSIFPLRSLATSAAPLSAADAEKIAAFAALPATNPYRDTFLLYAQLPAADRDALARWVDPASGSESDPAPASPLTSAQRAIATELAAALRAAASAPPATAADWPLIPNPAAPDNPAAITHADIGSIRHLARLASRDAADLPPAEAIDTYAAIAQLGRQQRAGTTLIQQLVGVAIEGIAHAEAARRLGDFSAADLHRLSAAWLALAPSPDLARAIAGEREIFFKPIIENILVPGLRELIAAGVTGDEPTPGPDTSDPDFTRDLRLSGLLDYGSGDRRISLENTRTGNSFTLRQGTTVEGIQLVTLDFEERLAVIRHGTHEAVIHLESKRISPRPSAAARLRTFFASFYFWDGQDAERTELRQALAAARAHPEGVDGYARDLLTRYQFGVDRQLALAASAAYPVELSKPNPETDPILALTMPSIGKVARTLNGAATASVMLQAAIHHRLLALGTDTDHLDPSDPWGSQEGVNFVHEPTSDGGFILRSRFETKPGAPYTYKFAAPDAGIIRAK